MGEFIWTFKYPLTYVATPLPTLQIYSNGQWRSPTVAAVYGSFSIVLTYNDPAAGTLWQVTGTTDPAKLTFNTYGSVMTVEAGQYGNIT